MNLFETYVKIGLKDEASAGAKQLTQTLGSGLKKAATVGLAAVGAASAGMVALTKNAIEEYAEYEQLVGGVETLFKESADTVMGYARQAYKTAGLSATAYMSTVTSFSASLLQSLGGDTEKAADLANQALTDMSDNANKMGTDISMIQNAYQGFAKANYTMLDNLKLGYGGTQAEMKRLIREAAALDDSIDASSMSFANIVKAINVVQTELGITGTTAKEAATTISGSVGSAKAAWSNLVAGFADENANMDQLVNEFVDSVVVAGQNVVPKIVQVGESVVGVVKNYGKAAAKYALENLDDAVMHVGNKLVDEDVGYRVSKGINQMILNAMEYSTEFIQDNGEEIVNILWKGMKRGFQGSFDRFLDTINFVRKSIGKDELTWDEILGKQSLETARGGGGGTFGSNGRFGSGGTFGETFAPSVTVNNYGGTASDGESIAKAVSDALQDMLDRRASIYG